MAGMAARMGVGRDTTPVGPLDTDCRERGLVGSIRERPVAGTTEVPFAPGRPLFPCCRWGPCDDGPTPCAHPRNVGLFIARRFVGEDRRAVDRVRGMAGMTKDTRPRRPVQGIADAGESCGIPVCCPQLPRYRPAMTGRARRVPGHRPVDLFYGYCGKNLLGLLRFRILLYARIMYRGPPHRGSCPFAQGNTREASQCWLGGTIRLHTG